MLYSILTLRYHNSIQQYTSSITYCPLLFHIYSSASTCLSNPGTTPTANMVLPCSPAQLYHTRHYYKGVRGLGFCGQDGHRRYWYVPIRKHTLLLSAVQPPLMKDGTTGELSSVLIGKLCSAAVKDGPQAYRKGFCCSGVSSLPTGVTVKP